MLSSASSRFIATSVFGITVPFLLTVFPSNFSNAEKRLNCYGDTMPDICTLITASEIDAMHIFNNPLTKSYQDPNQFEGNSACIYEFFKPNDYPSLFIGLIKYSSKENAADQFHQFRVSHRDTWGIDSELLLYLGDSASFDLNANDPTKCDECNLFVKQGYYFIDIKFKGQFDEVPRERKKTVGINIVKLMYDRILELRPKRIGNKQ